MLSRKDIEKELGKNINIYPLNLKNFKENSINLCAGFYAWSLMSGTVYFNQRNKQFTLKRTDSKDVEIKFSRGKKAVWKNKNVNYIILLPRSTTLIETKETLAVGPNIGGTYHSKVGMVSQGTGHIGTMLGPNFSGNSLIALHNVTDKVLSLKSGESFVSVVFHYLNTPITEKNPTVSGHVDKMAELGINLTQSEREDLSADWRGKIEEVRQKMMNSNEYKEFQKRKKQQWTKCIKNHFTRHNFFLGGLLIIMLMVLGFIFFYLDKTSGSTIWQSRYWEVIRTGVLVTIIVKIIGSFK